MLIYFRFGTFLSCQNAASNLTIFRATGPTCGKHKYFFQNIFLPDRIVNGQNMSSLDIPGTCKS